MKRLLGILFVSAVAFAAPPDPYLISNKVQQDLDGVLSRLIPTTQFLIQVNTDIETRTEKRLVEGETLVESRQPASLLPARQVEPMPGFVPETEETPAPPAPPPVRQMYRMVEQPELRSVKVNLTFDDALTPAIQAKAMQLVRVYLQANYSGKAALLTGTMPMLKPEPPRDLAAVPPPPPPKEEKKEEPKPLSESEILWSYARWALIGLVFAVLLLVLATRKGASASPVVVQTPPAPRPEPKAQKKPSSLRDVEGFGPGPQAQPAAVLSISVAERRRRILERFLSRSQAFREYFSQLSTESAAELYGCLQGPAFDKLLRGLALAKPRGAEDEPSNMDEILEHHQITFDEFVHAKDWQERQFFGYLHSLSNEQLATLVASETPESACLILRMMQPAQSAAVLDKLSPAKRAEIMGQVGNLQNMAFGDLLNIERSTRQMVQQMPDRFFGKKEDVDFWGTVVSESEDQELVFRELQKLRPDIAPMLGKFRFKLEEAASLPDSLLERVLSNTDNEELCLALATCAANVREVLMDAVSPMRRKVLEGMFPSYRGAARDRTVPARTSLTRKIREALG
ncbi:hypothetical protein K2X33_05950 [bacterium]|nr:hypothetical protein [bacterium]